jgi:hypothetical protein
MPRRNWAPGRGSESERGAGLSSVSQSYTTATAPKPRGLTPSGLAGEKSVAGGYSALFGRFCSQKVFGLNTVKRVAQVHGV